MGGEKISSLCDTVTLLGHASWRRQCATAVRSRHSSDKKVREQKGRTWQPRTTGFNIKRMLSQQSHPFSCDTIQLLVTRSTRRGGKVRQAQCLLNERGNRSIMEDTAVSSMSLKLAYRFTTLSKLFVIVSGSLSYLMLVSCKQIIIKMGSFKWNESTRTGSLQRAINPIFSL